MMFKTISLIIFLIRRLLALAACAGVAVLTLQSSSIFLANHGSLTPNTLYRLNLPFSINYQKGIKDA